MSELMSREVKEAIARGQGPALMAAYDRRKRREHDVEQLNLARARLHWAGTDLPEGLHELGPVVAEAGRRVDGLRRTACEAEAPAPVRQELGVAVDALREACEALRRAQVLLQQPGGGA